MVGNAISGPAYVIYQNLVEILLCGVLCVNEDSANSTLSDLGLARPSRSFPCAPFLVPPPWARPSSHPFFPPFAPARPFLLETKQKILGA